MRKCYMCEISEDETFLYEGIHKLIGIVSVCRKCYFKNKMPLIEKKEIDLEEINKRGTVRERLSRLAKIPSETNRIERKKLVEDTSLKDLVEKNFKKNLEESVFSHEDVFDNFHWIIMRKRRILKMTREELANKIHEQVIVVQALEEGKLPKDYKILLKKVESALGINLLKDKSHIGSEDIVNESRVPTGIMVSDLKDKYLKRIEDEVLNEVVEARKGEKKIDLKKDSIELEDLDLKKVEEIVGRPVRDSLEEDFNEEDISKFAWGR